MAEACAERAVVALLEHAVVEDKVLRGVRHVRHHDRDRVAGVQLETGSDRVTEPGRQVRALAPDARELDGDPVDDVGGAVPARVVDHEDLMVDPGTLELADGARTVSPIDSASLWAGMTTESLSAWECELSAP